MNKTSITASYLRDQTIGIDHVFNTPFGERMMVYADYTASGRGLKFVEDYMQQVLTTYANTHTEDDMSGRETTSALHAAEHAIKQAVNAGANGRIVSVGSGSTGAIERLQQMVGVASPPASRQNLQQILHSFLGDEQLRQFERFQALHQPVIFVGPYEHHSNEVTWREGLATVVEVNLADDGGIDLEHLESLLQKPEYQNRLRIGAFSAASNVTGMRSPVHDIARLLHRHDGYAFFDYAASAPYVEIDMNPAAGNGDDASLDAIYVSPHKFLGGPGSAGILVFNERIYHRELGPCVAGGGTVDYVGTNSHDFIPKIEDREKAGTPGILQTLKAALTFEIKAALGVEYIEKRENELLQKAFTSWNKNPRLEILGNPDPERRIGIVSFNVRDPRGLHLHPKFVTSLLNDLFGIQSRAGCSCAGPYGHRLLNIDNARSEVFRHWILKGYNGIKPGWCRVGFHYSMDDIEAEYIIDAVIFIADYGYRFLEFYDFDLATGAWNHKQATMCRSNFSLQSALNCQPNEKSSISLSERTRRYQQYLEQARKLANEHEQDHPGDYNRLSGGLAELQFFTM